MASTFEGTVGALLLLLASGCSLVGGGGADCDASRIEIKSQAQLDALAGCTTIAGTLIVNTVSGVTAVDLPRLEELGDVFFITGNPDLRTVSMPKLRRFRVVNPHQAESVIQGNSALKSFDLGALDQVGDDTNAGEQVASLAVVNNTTLETLQLRSLREVRGKLTLDALAGVTTVDLSRLERAGNVAVRLTNLTALSLPLLAKATVDCSDNPILASVTLPAATEASLQLTKNPKLATLEVPLATTAPVVILEDNLLGDVNFAALTRIDLMHVRRNPGLRTLKAAAATSLVGALLIDTNVLLVALDFAALASAEIPANFGIHDNPKLPDCQALTIAAAIGRSAGTIHNNLGDGCPPQP